MSNFTDTFPGARIAGRVADLAAFKEGWAKVPFTGRTPHYLRDVSDAFRKEHPDFPEDHRAYIALCGVTGVTNERNGLFAPGNFPLCKRCMKKAPRWATKEERDTTVPPDVLRLFKGNGA